MLTKLFCAENVEAVYEKYRKWLLRQGTIKVHSTSFIKDHMVYLLVTYATKW